jgi:hypothetical protein
MPKPAGRRDSVFISCRGADTAGHAGRLEEDLTRLVGDRVFMDVSEIALGADFEVTLRGELASCGAVLALIGPRWREALDAPREGPDHVRLELGQALADAGVQPTATATGHSVMSGLLSTRGAAAYARQGRREAFSPSTRPPRPAA